MELHAAFDFASGQVEKRNRAPPNPCLCRIRKPGLPMVRCTWCLRVYSSAGVGPGLVGRAGRRQMCRGKVDELEKQVGGWDTHGAGYVLSDVCTPQRRSGARPGLGAVSDDRGGVGDFCFVVCEVEVGGRWRSEQRRADGLEMPRWRQRAIGKISHVSRCRTAASLRSGFLNSFARKCGTLRMTNARE
jgi:hypothetical protein